MIARGNRYPHTKKGLVQLAKKKYGMDVEQVAVALKENGINFDEDGWEAAVKALEKA